MACHLCAKPTCLGECSENWGKYEKPNNEQKTTFVIGGDVAKNPEHFLSFLKDNKVDFVSIKQDDLLYCKGFGLSEVISKYKENNALTAFSVDSSVFDEQKNNKPKFK